MVPSLGLLASVLFVAGCGAGSNPTVQVPPPEGTAYSVVVTGTANGIVHDAQITVIVR
jgi:hypothetical protein